MRQTEDPPLSQPLLAKSSRGLTAEEDKYGRIRRRAPLWTVDRGSGFYQQERDRLKKPSLLETGRHAGRSRVLARGIEFHKILIHILRRDLFTSAVHLRLHTLILVMLVCYLVCFLIWAAIYYTIWWIDGTCFSGFHNFISAFLFAIETQSTIGFGARAPTDCWTPAWLMAVHTILALALNSMFLGIFFAKVSHPKARARTILISDSAVIARRDGVLMLMFRVADLRSKPVISPLVRVFLYTWARDRYSAEGEYLPLRMEELHLNDDDAVLLLPLTFTHTIDETSPLFGQTHQRLEALNAEIIVTFEGINEFGDSFAVRQSYLPLQIRWGHTFVPIIYPAPQGETRHIVELSRFHDVEPQAEWVSEMLPMAEVSRRIVQQGSDATVPRDVVGESTLLVSDTAVITHHNGGPCLMFRVGDSHPGQMLDVRVRAFVYRYSYTTQQGSDQDPAWAQELELEPCQPLLRYPVLMMHPLNERSPVAGWAAGPEALRRDADAEVAVTVQGIVHATGNLIQRMRLYPILRKVLWGHQFAPILTPPAQSPDGRGYVMWDKFHETISPSEQQPLRRVSSNLAGPSHGEWPSRPGSSGQQRPPHAPTDGEASSEISRNASPVRPISIPGVSFPSAGYSASSNSAALSTGPATWHSNRSLANVFQAFLHSEAASEPAAGASEGTAQARAIEAAEEGKLGQDAP